MQILSSTRQHCLLLQPLSIFSDLDMPPCPLSLWERVRVRGFVPEPAGPSPPALSRGERELYALLEVAHLYRARVAPATPGQYNALAEGRGSETSGTTWRRPRCGAGRCARRGGGARRDRCPDPQRGCVRLGDATR